MREIPTLFKKKIDKNNNYLGVMPRYNININPEQHLAVTIKYDGLPCAIINGRIYKRYDINSECKRPNGIIFCDGYIPTRKHNFSWVPCCRDYIEDKYYWNGYDRGFTYQNDDLVSEHKLCDGTYELIGKNIKNNPYDLQINVLIRHGADIIEIITLANEPLKVYNYFRDMLDIAWIEGVVLWTIDDNSNIIKPIATICKKDFRFKWGK